VVAITGLVYDYRTQIAKDIPLIVISPLTHSNKKSKHSEEKPKPKPVFLVTFIINHLLNNFAPYQSK
jgi:uncharacterized membrane protein YadS